MIFSVPKKAPIFLGVCLGHLLLVWFLAHCSTFKPARTPKKVRVQTVALKPSVLPISKQQAASYPCLKEKTEPVKPTAKPKSKTASSPKSAPLKRKSGKKETSSQAVNKNEGKQTWIEQAAKSLQQAERLAMPSNTVVIKQADLSLPIGTINGKESCLYGERVAALLQSLLCLPKPGKAVLKLTIAPSGKLQQLEILESDAFNASYIRQALQNALFPALLSGMKDDYICIVHLQGE